ncbi:MAG: phosphoribosylamine--glycine ligase [Candidatus Methylacidiphilales bacterium]
MKILIVGNGGREHALGWSLHQDPRVNHLWFAPGNAGTARLGHQLDIAAADTEAILRWAVVHQPDLVVVGPEVPLCLGLVDKLSEHGIKAFGPNRAAAQLEGSKVFCKTVLREAGIPTAVSAAFSSLSDALLYIEQASFPLVIKADGLAAGKGVIICHNVQEASDAIHAIMEQRQFGHAGDQVLIEEFLEGREASIHALCDGRDLLFLSPSQDHKRIFDGDLGPNTGGMGAYAPTPAVDAEQLRIFRDLIFQPLIDTLRTMGIEYRGVLYGGLMLTAQGPKVLEFNCRFGDPETQVLLPLLETPLLDLLLAVVEGRLREVDFRLRPGSVMTVVMASHGYPESSRSGDVISGLEAAEAAGALVFHAGTAHQDGHIVTQGGRVLAVSGWGASLAEARDQAYAGVEKISFPGAQSRRDIGYQALGLNRRHD